MAEQLIFCTAHRIITLGSLPVKEIGLLWRVEDELQSLRNTVSTIKAVLLDAEEKQAAENHAVRNWLGKLEDAIYEADDLLDAVSTEALRREVMTRDKKAKKVRIFFSKSNQLAFRLKMAHKIKAIRERLRAINAYRQGSNFAARPVEETRVWGKRDTHSFVCAEKVIGRDEDKKAVIDRLLDSNVEENVTIHPIVGIGGLGKTTLAKLIFNDDQIQKHFLLKMWVCVSHPFDVPNIVEKIFKVATETNPKGVDQMETLVRNLKEKIDGKKYLLVLDDVWNEDHEEWSRLAVVLMGGATGSRIVVTTRSEMVASTIRRGRGAGIIKTVESYSLKGLDDGESWSLFKQMAFKKGQEPDENSSIVKLGKEMLQKCSGVPLAIKTIGISLYFKNSETEWLSFKNNELSKISDENETGILLALKPSYDHLPSHLKHCFAYCGLYPKGYWFDKSTLIQLWIAQEFVNVSNRNKCLEDVGHEYFMDLLWRSFFQEAETDEFGNITGCKMHDLIHDLAISVAGSLITTLNRFVREVDEKTRHVSVVDCDIDASSITTSLCKVSRKRTLICHPTSNNFWGESDCEAIFSSSKFLRVFDLHGRNFDFLPSSIGKLQFLRYLDLSGNYNIKKLPDSITTLHNLKTLILSKCGSLKQLPGDFKKLVNLRHLEMDGCVSLKELPGDFKKLVNLRHLKMNGCRSLEELPIDIKKLINLRHLEIDECHRLTYMPRGLEQLTNLQKLSRFVVNSSHSDSGGLSELSRLNNLSGKLVIENLEHGKGAVSEYKDANLKEKEHLNALHLWWSNRGYFKDSDVANDEASLEGFQPHPNLKHLRLVKYRGSMLPSWLLSLTNLVRFELYWCKKCQFMPLLSQLPSLKYLLLISLDAMEYISEGGDSYEKKQFFPSLKELSLSGCRNLKGWWRRDSSVEVNTDETTEHCLLPYFPHLSTLSISSCPMLTSMPMFPHLEEKLVLDNPSLKLLEQTMMMNTTAPQNRTSTATASSSSTPLSKLKSIQLISIADLKTLPLQNLTSLESLTISGCHRLKSLFPGIQHLTALQYLHVENCLELELELANDEDGMQWQGLTSLLSLCFSRLPKLVSLPSRLQYATTLQKLKISHCVSLTAMPKWIHNCKSLEVLEIHQCLGLASLPEEMRRLTSLQCLRIVDCPVLFQRCKREIGEDWPKISHIPDLDLP